MRKKFQITDTGKKDTVVLDTDNDLPTMAALVADLRQQGILTTEPIEVDDRLGHLTIRECSHTVSKRIYTWIGENPNVDLLEVIGPTGTMLPNEELAAMFHLQTMNRRQAARFAILCEKCTIH